MGGPASDDSVLSELWATRRSQLRLQLHPGGQGGLIVPLGLVCPGLGRHRALLFKYLADSLCIPCEIRQMRSSDFSNDLLVIVILKVSGIAGTYARRSRAAWPHGGEDLLVDLMRNPGSVTSPEVIQPVAPTCEGSPCNHFWVQTCRAIITDKTWMVHNKPSHCVVLFYCNCVVHSDQRVN
eukprot:scaffold39296_cov43-Prasinocladus_malaysianus.AAC.1